MAISKEAGSFMRRQYILAGVLGGVAGWLIYDIPGVSDYFQSVPNPFPEFILRASGASAGAVIGLLLLPIVNSNNYLEQNREFKSKNRE